MKAGRIVRRRSRSTVPRLSVPIGRSSPQSKILLQILKEATLFHAPDGTAHADIRIKGHRETWKVRSLGFREWLTSSFHKKTGGAPNNDAMQQASQPTPETVQRVQDSRGEASQKQKHACNYESPVTCGVRIEQGPETDDREGDRKYQPERPVATRWYLFPFELRLSREQYFV